MIEGSNGKTGLSFGATARLEVSVQRSHQAVYVLRVVGEIDLGNYQLLERPLLALLEEPTQRVIVDLSDCVFMDSTGIHVLVRARRAIATNGSDKPPLVVCGARGQVRRVLELCGVADAIPLVPTQQEALELVEPGIPSLSSDGASP